MPYLKEKYIAKFADLKVLTSLSTPQGALSQRMIVICIYSDATANYTYINENLQKRMVIPDDIKRTYRKKSVRPCNNPKNGISLPAQTSLAEDCQSYPSNQLPYSLLSKVRIDRRYQPSSLCRTPL